MTRSVPAPIMAALQSNDPKEVFLAVELSFDSGALRLWSGVGPVSLEGQVYTGGGNLLAVSGLDEVRDLEARGAAITLSGIPSSLVQTALDEQARGRAVRILFGITGQSDVVVAFAGLIDKMPIEDDGATATISVQAESKLITLERPRVYRYTHESHQALEPGDTFFAYVADLQDKEIVWGRKSNNA